LTIVSIIILFSKNNFTFISVIIFEMIPVFAACTVDWSW